MGWKKKSSFWLNRKSFQAQNGLSNKAQRIKVSCSQNHWCSKNSKINHWHHWRRYEKPRICYLCYGISTPSSIWIKPFDLRTRRRIFTILQTLLVSVLQIFQRSRTFRPYSTIPRCPLQNVRPPRWSQT